MKEAFSVFRIKSMKLFDDFLNLLEPYFQSGETNYVPKPIPSFKDLFPSLIPEKKAPYPLATVVPLGADYEFHRWLRPCVFLTKDVSITFNRFFVEMFDLKKFCAVEEAIVKKNLLILILRTDKIAEGQFRLIPNKGAKRLYCKSKILKGRKFQFPVENGIQLKNVELEVQMLDKNIVKVTLPPEIEQIKPLL